MTKNVALATIDGFLLFNYIFPSLVRRKGVIALWGDEAGDGRPSVQRSVASAVGGIWEIQVDTRGARCYVLGQRQEWWARPYQELVWRIPARGSSGSQAVWWLSSRLAGHKFKALSPTQGVG
ncbi:MAG: hypothetical protein AAB303_00220 [Chloroflexota bacterium]